MNHPPQQSEAKPDLARTLRESCVRFTEAADESFFFRQIYLLLAALFGKIEDMFLLWKAGNLPPPPVHQPTQNHQTRTSSRTTSQRHKTGRRTASKASTARPIRVQMTPENRQHPTRTQPTLKPDAPTRRIDRPPKTPKSQKIAANPQKQTHAHFITIQQ